MRPRRSPVAIVIAVLSIGMVAAPVTAALDPNPAGRAPTDSAALTGGQVQLQAVTGGLTAPLGVVNAGDGSGRLFIVEQRGTVRVSDGAGIFPGFFLDIRGIAGGITSGNERGLLGLAFHPSFETNRKFYVYYTDGGGDLRISEFTANAAGTAWDGAAPVGLIFIEHSSQGNHNGGQLLFGPDGNLYIFTGDGGGSGDPFCNAQDTDSTLGKVLRISVPGNGTFSNPAGNLSGVIWDLGLRNPWRASFDRATGDLWIGDVGQGAWEEINFRPAGTTGGRNWGWSDREGAHPYSGDHCPSSGIPHTDPSFEYQQGSPKSVTGGFVYRGSLEPDLVGHYVFTDFFSGNLWTMSGGGAIFHGSTGAMISSFGESESGELYAVDLSAGMLYRVVAPPYRDIVNSPFYDDIKWLHASGITTGCTSTTFCPHNVVTREQMASFIARAVPSLPPASGDFFTDDETSIHEGDINRIATAGITLGCGPNLYCPHSPVTREQMASFLVRALSLDPSGTDFFTDDTGSQHEGDINAFAAAGITTGCGGGQYCPTAFVTREQMAAFLHRALD